MNHPPVLRSEYITRNTLKDKAELDEVRRTKPHPLAGHMSAGDLFLCTDFHDQSRASSGEEKSDVGMS